MKSFWTGALAATGVFALVAAFLLGRGCAPTQTVYSGPDLDITGLKMQLDSLRVQLAKQGHPQEVLVRVEMKGDTMLGTGYGQTQSSPVGRFFYYKDSLIDFRADLSSNRVNYTIFPHRFAGIMGLEGQRVWAKFWDITTGDSLLIDGIEVSRPKWNWNIGAGVNIASDGRIRPELGLGLNRGKLGINIRAGNGVSLGLVRTF